MAESPIVAITTAAKKRAVYVFMYLFIVLVFCWNLTII
jgi:hypothetical protein